MSNKVTDQKSFLVFNYLFVSSLFGKKIISYLIKKGKKQKAEKIFYNFLLELSRLTNSRLELFYFKKALLLILPFYETRSFKLRGEVSTITIPLYSKKRRLFLLFKYLLNFLKKQPKSFSKKLASTIFQISKKEGLFYQTFQKSVITSQSYPKMHFRWI